jgi:thiol-disulfide isomerase/thioredoxin
MNANSSARFIALLVAITSCVYSFAVNRVSFTRSSRLNAIGSIGKEEEREKKSTKPNVLHIESIEDYKQEVIDSSQITVVRFYSRYCKSCQASEPLFYKLARDFQENGVKFVEVPLTPQTIVLHEALGVPSLPWTHIYHPDAGLVEERKVSKKFIDEVRTCLRCYVYGECDLEDAPADCMEVYGECAVDYD